MAPPPPPTTTQPEFTLANWPRWNGARPSDRFFAAALTVLMTAELLAAATWALSLAASAAMPTAASAAVLFGGMAGFYALWVRSGDGLLVFACAVVALIVIFSVSLVLLFASIIVGSVPQPLSIVMWPPGATEPIVDVSGPIKDDVLVRTLETLVGPQSHMQTVVAIMSMLCALFLVALLALVMQARTLYRRELAHALFGTDPTRSPPITPVMPVDGSPKVFEMASTSRSGPAVLQAGMVDEFDSDEPFHHNDVREERSNLLMRKTA